MRSEPPYAYFSLGSVHTVDVSRTGSISVAIDPAVGADSSEYFIRFISQDHVDPASAYGVSDAPISAVFNQRDNS